MFVNSSNGITNLDRVGLRAIDRGAVKFTTLYLWAVNLKPLLVAHPCMALTVHCRCLSVVTRERPRLSDHQRGIENVHGNMKGQLVNL